MEWLSLLLGFGVLGALGLWCWWHDKPELVPARERLYQNPNGLPLDPRD